MKISDKIRQLRKDKQMTLTGVRDKLKNEFGETHTLSVPYLSEIERGISTPSIKTLDKLAKVFDISISELLANVEFHPETLEDKLQRLPTQSRNSFKEFMEWIKVIYKEDLDENWMNTLLKIEYRGKHPESKEGWFDIYRTLKMSFDDKS